MSDSPPVKCERLLGESILLRRVCLDDAEALYEAAIESRAELHPWMPWCPETSSRDDASEWLAERGEAWGLHVRRRW